MLDQTNIAPVEMAEETVPRTGVLLHVWWAMAWRQFLWFVVVSIAFNVASVILGFALSFAGIDDDVADTFGHVFGLTMVLLGNIWAFTMAFRQVLGKNFSGHKLLFLAYRNRA